MTSIQQQRSIEIRAGFSPKPVTAPGPDTVTSPSREPETKSPSGLLDGPDLSQIGVEPPLSPEIIIKDGIVSFGK